MYLGKSTGLCERCLSKIRKGLNGQAADRVTRIVFVNSEVFALGNRHVKWVKLFKQKLAHELAQTPTGAPQAKGRGAITMHWT